MDIIAIIGLSAAVLANIAFVPQMYQTWKTKKTRDLSTIMLFTYLSALVLWLIYGIARKDQALIISNLAILAQFSVVIYVKIRYEFLKK